ncbi:MAG: glycosyltransferase [Nitrososphaera sp.]|nr:glycosyltransferase [Nitrososphaera sp.]
MGLKAHLPTFGSYLILHNAVQNRYPFIECIKNALSFSNHVYVLECNSTDDTYERVYQEFKDTDNIILKRSTTEWDMNDTCIVGKKKQEARAMVQDDFCVYLDADEILAVKSRDALLSMVLNNSHANVFALPYITFFGDPYKVGNFKDAENYWRWKVFANKPNIGHGVHGKARKYDENGRLYLDKSISDGCELIDLKTLDVVSALLFMPPHYIQAGEQVRGVVKDEEIKTKCGAIISEVLNDFPLVCWHYGWVDFENKAINGLNYWTKTKSFKSGVTEHSGLFNQLTSIEVKQTQIDEWKRKATIPLRIREHPQIMKPTLTTNLKPKILNISLSSSGPYGVPKWGKSLFNVLNESYDIQHFAFEDYNTQVPPNAREFHKAESFIKFLNQTGADKDATIIFGDGFWAATYQGPARVVSVIHGLWAHPDREKWGDDGLRGERRELYRYQLEYFKKAKEMKHTLICVSPFIHRILKEEHGIDSILIPNAIDVDKFDKITGVNVAKTRPLILHGITSVNKGLDILPAIENHPLIKDAFDIASIDEIAKHLNVSKEETFKIADVAFLPTKWEASSYLLLECLANNLPICAYRAGILRCEPALARMDSVGVVVDDYDVDTFAKSIVDAYKNRLKYSCGRLFLKENGMTQKDWDDRIKKLIYEVL